MAQDDRLPRPGVAARSLELTRQAATRTPGGGYCRWVSIDHLVGHRFDGGRRTIEHWENFLLTEVCGGPQLPGEQAHPVHLFHVPIDGAGLTIADLFDLADAEGPDRVGLESYDWEYLAPLRVGIDYRCEGEITSAQRRSDGDREWDELVFAIEMSTDGGVVARVTNTWQIWRSS
jgi:hypothetical protein